MSMARNHNDASKTAGAVEVCCGVLGPDIIKQLDENNGLISLQEERGLWCYIEMRTPSSGKTQHYFEKEGEGHGYTENKFETLDELKEIISKFFYDV